MAEQMAVGIGGGDDLRANVRSISSRLDEIKGQVFETVRKHYEDFVQAYRDTTDINSEIKILAADISALQAKVKTADAGKALASVADQRTLSTQIHAHKTAIKVLETLCQLHDILGEYEIARDRRDWCAAAEHAAAATSFVSTIAPGTSDSAACDPSIFAAVRNEVRRVRGTVLAEADDRWAQAVSWRLLDGPTMPSLTMLSSTKSTGQTQEVPFTATVFCLHRLGALSARVQSLARLVLQQLLLPLVNDPQLSPTVSTSSGTLTLSLARSEAARKAVRSKKSPRCDPAELFPKMQVVLSAVLEHFRAHDDANEAYHVSAFEVSGLVGSALEGDSGLYAAIITQCLSKVFAATNEMESVQQAVDAFEAFLLQKGLISAVPGPLAESLGGACVSRADQQKQELLNEARAIIMADSMATVSVAPSAERGGPLAGRSFPAEHAALADQTRSAFVLPACQISSAAHALVDLAYATLSSVKPSEPNSAAAKLFAVRDMFDLFRAITPTRLHEKIESVPSIAAVFFNDCFYIAHHMLTLGYQFRTALPPGLAGCATFMDMVPVMQALGETQLDRAVSAQKKNFIESLTGISKSVARVEDDAQRDGLLRQLKRVYFELDRLAAAWEPLLPEPTYAVAVGTIVDAIAALLVAAVLSMDDITEAQSDHLSAVLADFAAHTETWLPATAKAETQLRDYDRALLIGRLLNARLMQIEEIWKSHQGLLSVAEMHHIIRALFSNSDQRAKCLLAIK